MSFILWALDSIFLKGTINDCEVPSSELVRDEELRSVLFVHHDLCIKIVLYDLTGAGLYLGSAVTTSMNTIHSGYDRMCL